MDQDQSHKNDHYDDDDDDDDDNGLFAWRVSTLGIGKCRGNAMGIKSSSASNPGTGNSPREFPGRFLYRAAFSSELQTIASRMLFNPGQ